MKTDNELIAEFMGVPKLPDKNGFVWDVSGTGKGIYSLHSKYLRYHEKWDWLMPVVEKIKSKGFYMQITFHERNSCSIGIAGSGTFSLSKSGENCTYKAVVEFIKWYNSQAEYKR